MQFLQINWWWWSNDDDADDDDAVERLKLEDLLIEEGWKKMSKVYKERNERKKLKAVNYEIVGIQIKKKDQCCVTKGYVWLCLGSRVQS